MSIPRRFTSLTTKEVETLFATARVISRSRACEIRGAPATQGSARILILVPKKVGVAPVRNKIKRQIRSIFYTEQLFEKGIDLIVLVRPSITALTFDQLKHLLLSIYAVPQQPLAGKTQ